MDIQQMESIMSTPPSRPTTAACAFLRVPALLMTFLCMAWLNPQPAAATDLANLTAVEREVLREEIRQLLLENPDIIIDALEAQRTMEAAEQEASDAQLIARFGDELFHDSHSWVGGNLDGDITLVEFLDYNCGFCRKSADVVDELIETDGNIRFVVKEYPILGTNSEIAALLAVSVLQLAGDQQYKSVHDLMMTHEGPYDDGFVSEVAGLAGIDPELIVEHIDSLTPHDAISANFQLAGNMGINSTPTFVIGNRMVRGYIPYSEMQEIVNQQRSGTN